MGFNCLKATEPLRTDSLLFTTQSPGVPGTYLINIGRMKRCDFTLEPPSSFEPRTPGLGNQHPNHTKIIGKRYVKCKCPVFINIRQTLHYKVATE